MSSWSCRGACESSSRKAQEERAARAETALERPVRARLQCPTPVMRRPGERVGSSQDIELIAEDLELFADGTSCSRCSGRNRAAPADPGELELPPQLLNARRT